MSVGGITENGLFNSNSLLVETERYMMQAADEVIVVADSGKLGHSELAHLCPLEDVDRLVVDGGITEDWRRLAADRGIELIVAS
jgi:DeoR/GlpR family transcriptional regulator of sugar metabolism